MEHDNQNAPPRPCSATCRNPCAAGLSARPPAPAPEPLRVVTPIRAPQPGSFADDALRLAVLLTAQMFHLTRETVVVSVLVSLPEMARLAEVNPLLAARLYAGSLHPLPESIERFYTRLAESPSLRQVLMDDYRATYGGMLDSVHRVAGQRAGITDGQARELLATLLPAINHVLGRANTGGAGEYARHLKELGA
jgi:hypothetical protein